MSLRFNKTMEDKEVLQFNTLQLAYVGDAVWEIIVRYDLISRKLNVHHMHQKCVQLVNAHSQACILHLIEESLSYDEREIVRRGRNTHFKHTIPQNQSPEDYSAATGFEALFGFWYLTGNNERISQITDMIKEVYFYG